MAKIRLKPVQIVIIVLAVGLAVTAGYIKLHNRPTKSADNRFLPKAEPPPPPPVAAAAVIPPPPPPPAAASNQTAGPAIIVDTPTTGATISSGSTVSGRAKVSGQLYYRVKGGQSGQLALAPVPLAADSSQYINFSFQISFSNDVKGGSDQGALELYTLTNGSETNLVSIAVNISG